MKKCLFYPHYYSLSSLISQRLSPCGQYEYNVPKKMRRRASYDVTPSNIFVIHSKLLISTTLHEHGTESQSDGGEDNRAEECDCDHSRIFLFVSTFVFSHRKDRPYSRTLQDFSTLFASDIATRWPNRDNPCHPIQNLSPRYQESSKNRRYTKRRWKMCFRSRPIDFINCKLIKLIIDKVDKVDKIDFFSLKH